MTSIIAANVIIAGEGMVSREMRLCCLLEEKWWGLHTNNAHLYQKYLYLLGLCN